MLGTLATLGTVAADGPSQLLVMGVHHSATSIAAKALNEMGLYVGKHDDLLLDADNPLKFWERRDVVAANQERLEKGRVKSLALSASMPPFVGLGFEPAQGTPLNASGAAKQIVAELNAHRPWAIKDPRLSLVASEWLPLLEKDAVCVLTVRHPLDFANTMMAYSRDATLSDWVGVWIRYMGSSLKACQAQPVALVPHAMLVREPEKALEALHVRLLKIGVKLPPLDAKALAAKLGLRSAPPEPTYMADEMAAAGPAALHLFEQLLGLWKDPTRPLPQVGPSPWNAMRTAPPARAPRLSGAREAYISLLTGPDEGYLAGALALGSSIRAFDGAREMVMMATQHVPRKWHDTLREVGWTVRPTERLPEFWWGKDARCRSWLPDQQQRWGHMSTKLRVWQLEQYSKVLYLDADTVLTGNPSALFDMPGFSAERGVSHNGFNAGVMLAQPSVRTFAELMKTAQGPPPNIFGSVIDCTEQGLLNLYYNSADKAHTPHLFEVAHPKAAAIAPSAADVAAPAVPVAHWITLHCPKPWMQKPASADGESLLHDLLHSDLPAECNASLYTYWWRLLVRTGSVSVLSAPASGPNRRRTTFGSEYDGCSVGCPDFWVNDGLCDAFCNVAECNYDGDDCFHGHSECFTEDDGKDYRGNVAITKSGRTCQSWAEQTPWHHTRTSTYYPDSGLGGHNFCRNPDGEPGPWCYTLDYPDMRFELCDVGTKAASCGDKKASPPAAPPQSEMALTLAKFSDGHVAELEMKHYDTPLPPTMTGIKVVLITINGDADLFISFDTPKPDRRTATWVEESLGVKQFVLAENNEHFCPKGRDGCHLYLTVSGFEEGDYKLILYNYTAEAIASGMVGASNQWDTFSCSPGCDELSLGNTICDIKCNTSDCIWDQGDCGYFGSYEMEDVCSAGCALSWVGDGYCDEACFNAACGWDETDCIDSDAGCADSCLPSFIDDLECDAVCNNEACGYDGTDCDYGADNCYTNSQGTDYRGSVSTTKSGLTCQVWSTLTPHQHTKSYMNFPTDGLGGHNHCRNPAAEEDGPWCYTMDPNVRFELCDVPPPEESCGVKDSANPYHYHTLCPVDCKNLLGNGLCETRCNISSCAFDRGDCGIGLDFAMVAAGYENELSMNVLYIMVGTGVAIGVSIGLLILRFVLRKIKKDEEKRRGYSEAEMKGMDTYDTTDDNH
jgi:hypothetical protein